MIKYQDIMLRRGKTAAQIIKLWTILSFILIPYLKSISIHHNEVNFHAAISELCLKNVKYQHMLFSWSKQSQGKNY